MESRASELSNFTFVDTLGEGSFGSIILVQEKTTQKFFTAQISRSECQSKKSQTYFDQEIQTLSNLSNPSLLPFYKISSKNFRKERYPTVITEYLSNGSLRKLMNKNKNIPLSKKYIILLGICEGMKYLHSQQVVHGNLAPENIFLDQDFHPHISDYGLYKISNFFESSIKSNSVSPVYKSPEIFSDSQYSDKSDVYSFSFIAYELLTGEFPFKKIKTVFRLQKAILKGKRPNITSIQNEKIQSIINQCWSTNPEDRPTFSQIIDVLKDKNVMKSMNADKKEVESLITPIKSHLPSLNPNPSKPKKSDNSQEKNSSNTNNDAKELFEKAKKLETGTGVKINKKEAAKFYKMAADKGHVESMFKYAEMIDENETNKKESKKYYKMAADKGHIDAMRKYANKLNKEGNEDNDNEKIKESKRLLKIAADKGNAAAMFDLGVCLYNESNEEINEESAKYFKMSIEKDYFPAIDFYGRLLLYSNDEKNKQEAVRLFKLGIDKGDKDSYYNYAIALNNGWGLEQNKEEAINYLKLASEKGNVKAMNLYGVYLYNGELIEKDLKEAARLFKCASDQGNVDATYNFANSLYMGAGIEQDKKEAVRYYKMAADKGDPSNKTKYADILYSADGIEQDYKEAAHYYKMAADEGDIKAMKKYASMLQYGEGVEKDLQEAANYLKAAIDKGDNDAFSSYLFLIKCDHFIDNDKESMLRLMKKAADEGNKSIMFDYAYLLYKGKYGIKPNLKEAAHYFKMIIMKDDDDLRVKCIYNYMLYNGEGVEANKEEAIQFFKNEIKDNSYYAIYYYARILFNSDKKADKKEAARYFHMSIDKGNSSSLYYYGLLLYNGQGIKMDKKKAAIYFKLAMEDDEENREEAEKMYRHIVDNGEYTEEEEDPYDIIELHEYLSYNNSII